LFFVYTRFLIVLPFYATSQQFSRLNYLRRHGACDNKEAKGTT
jgi:hypothetical protein